MTTDFGPPISPPTGNQDRVASACEPYRELIEQGLSRGRNAMAIWQDLVSDHGFPHGYQTVKRFVHKLRGSTEPQAVGIIRHRRRRRSTGRLRHGPDGARSAERQVPPDAAVRDDARLQPQVGSLAGLSVPVHASGPSCMRKPFVDWAGVRASWFSTICARESSTPDIYDPTLNPLFRDVLAHYGVVAMPCRVRDPDRKGKVEAGVGHAQKTPLKGLRFESLEEAQAYLDRWEERWADTRIHGTTKRQVAAMFAEEKPSLLPLPLEPFRYYQYGERVVHLDGCVEVEAAYYGLPPGWIGRSVKVQWDALHVRILHPGTNQLLREHIRQKRGWYRIKKPKTTRRKCRSVPRNCCGERATLGTRSAYFLWPSISDKARRAFAASWGSSPWPRNTARQRSKMPAPRPSRSVCRSIASCAVISSAAHN